MATIFANLKKIDEHFRYDRAAMRDSEQTLMDHFGEDDRRYRSLMPFTMNSVKNGFPMAKLIKDIFDVEYSMKSKRNSAEFVKKCTMMQSLRDGHRGIHDMIRDYIDNFSRNVYKPFSKGTKHPIRLTDNINIYLDYASVISRQMQFVGLKKERPFQLDIYIIPHVFEKHDREKRSKRTVHNYLKKLNMGNMENVMTSDYAFRQKFNYGNGIKGMRQLFRDFKDFMEHDALASKSHRAVLVIERGNNVNDTLNDTLRMFVPPTKNTLPTELCKFTDLCWYHNSNGEVVPGKDGLNSNAEGVLNWSIHCQPETTEVHQYYGNYGSRVFKFNFKEMLQTIFAKSKRKIDPRSSSEFNLNYQAYPDKDYALYRGYFMVSAIQNLDAKAQEFVPSFGSSASSHSLPAVCLPKKKKLSSLPKINIMEAIVECHEIVADMNQDGIKSSITKPLIEFKPVVTATDLNTDLNTDGIKSSITRPLIRSKPNVTATVMLPERPIAPIYSQMHMIEEPLKLVHGSRANLNIFIEQKQTSDLLDGIVENNKFNNHRDLYYYIDYSTSMQVIDGLARKYTSQYGKVGIVNIELHSNKGNNNAELFMVIIPNDSDRNAKVTDERKESVLLPKWEWKLDAFMTKEEITRKYCIAFDRLPLGSRRSNYFERQRDEPIQLRNNFADRIQWTKLLQYSSKTKGKFNNKKNKKNGNANGKQVCIKESDLNWYCYNSYFGQRNELVPIVIMENKKFKIHKTLIVDLEHLCVRIGITFKFNKNSREWDPRSICLDPGDILNKWRLVGSPLTPLVSKLNLSKNSIRKLQITRGI